MNGHVVIDIAVFLKNIGKRSNMNGNYTPTALNEELAKAIVQKENKE